MGLSSLLLVGSLIAGSVSGLLWWRFNWFVGALAGAAIWFLTTMAAAALHNLDFFGIVHVLYLAAVVSLPITAVIRALTAWAEPGKRGASSVLLVIGGLLAATGIYATHVEPFWLRVDEVNFTSKRVTNNFRLAVVSDIQNSEVGDYERNAIDRIIAADPDIVLMAGDLWQMEASDQWEERRDQFAELIARLVDGVPLVVMVEGHGDFIDGYDWLVSAAGGGVVLWDEGIETEVNGQGLRIGGLALFPDATPRRADVLEFVTEQRTDFSILLAHTPNVVFELDGAVPDLVIAGHTHGGQVALPLFGAPVTFSEVSASVGAGGLHEVNGASLYVTTGVGLERGQAPQIRFGSRPSFAIIDVAPEASG